MSRGTKDLLPNRAQSQYTLGPTRVTATSDRVQSGRRVPVAPHDFLPPSAPHDDDQFGVPPAGRDGAGAGGSGEDLVAVLKTKLDKQRHELDNRTDNVNAIQRNFQRLSEMYSGDRAKLAEAEERVASMTKELEALRAEKKVSAAVRSEFTALQARCAAMVAEKDAERGELAAKIEQLAAEAKAAAAEKKLLQKTAAAAAEQVEALQGQLQGVDEEAGHVEHGLNMLLDQVMLSHRAGNLRPPVLGDGIAMLRRGGGGGSRASTPTPPGGPRPQADSTRARLMAVKESLLLGASKALPPLINTLHDTINGREADARKAAEHALRTVESLEQLSSENRALLRRIGKLELSVLELGEKNNDVTEGVRRERMAFLDQLDNAPSPEAKALKKSLLAAFEDPAPGAGRDGPAVLSPSVLAEQIQQLRNAQDERQRMMVQDAQTMKETMSGVEARVADVTATAFNSNAAAARQLDLLKQENERLTQRVKLAQDEVDALQVAEYNAKAKIQSLGDANVTLTQTVATLSEQLTVLQARLSEGRSQADRQTKSQEEYADRVARLTLELEQHRNQYEAHMMSCAKKDQARDAERQREGQKLVQAQRDLANATERAAQAAAENNALRCEKEHLAAEVMDLQAQVQALEHTVASSASDGTVYKQRYEETEAARAALAAQLDNATHLLSASEALLKEKEMAIHKLTKDAEHAVMNAEVQKNLADNNASTVIALRAEVARLQQQKTDLATKLTTVEAAAELANNKVAALEAEKMNLQAAAVEARRTLDSLLEAHKDYNEKRQAMEGEKAEAAAKAAHLRQQQEACYSTCKKLKAAEEACESGYSCQHCMEIVNSPVICAPCGHTYCKQCFNDNHNSKKLQQGARKEKHCPECDSFCVTHVIPSQSMDLLAGKFTYRKQALNDLLQLLEKDRAVAHRASTAGL